jgi:hypothetical protein
MHEYLQKENVLSDLQVGGHTNFSILHNASYMAVIFPALIGGAQCLYVQTIDLKPWSKLNPMLRDFIRAVIRASWNPTLNMHVPIVFKPQRDWSRFMEREGWTCETAPDGIMFCVKSA